MRPHRWQPTRLPHPWDSSGKNTEVGCHFLLNAWKWKVKVKSLGCVQLLATPWTAAYQAPPSMGFFQARVLEWGAIAFSTGNQWDAPKTATPATGIGEQNRPNSYSQHHPTAIILQNNAVLNNTQPILQKLNELGYEVLPHLPYLPDLPPTDYHFKHLNNFLQGKCFHNQQDTENCYSRVCRIPKHGFLCSRNK